MKDNIKKTSSEESFPSTPDKLHELELKCEEYLNNWKRERADFLNYKKDEDAKIQSVAAYSKLAIFNNLLAVLDSIDLAEKNMPESFKKDPWTEGFLQIQNQVQAFLKREGISEIIAEGQKFDPSTMEVVEMTEGKESEMVVEVLQKGYQMENIVIRPAKIKVTK